MDKVFPLSDKGCIALSHFCSLDAHMCPHTHEGVSAVTGEDGASVFMLLQTNLHSHALTDCPPHAHTPYSTHLYPCMHTHTLTLIYTHILRCPNTLRYTYVHSRMPIIKWTHTSILHVLTHTHTLRVMHAQELVDTFRCTHS